MAEFLQQRSWAEKRSPVLTDSFVTKSTALSGDHIACIYASEDIYGQAAGLGELLLSKEDSKSAPLFNLSKIDQASYSCRVMIPTSPAEERVLESVRFQIWLTIRDGMQERPF